MPASNSQYFACIDGVNSSIFRELTSKTSTLPEQSQRIVLLPLFHVLLCL
jgi:hypothetical protein